MYFISLFFLTYLLPSASHNPWSQSIDSIVHHAIENKAFPGCVIYVAQSDSILFHKSYGYFTHDSLHAVQLNTLYDVASLTKTTASGLALMKMYEEGLYQLDDKIGSYIHGLGKLRNSTFREIFAHQAGWKPWIPYYQYVTKKNRKYKKKTLLKAQLGNENYPFKIADSLWLYRDFYRSFIKKMIKKSPLNKEKKYAYSGLFFYLVPELVAKLTGRSFEEYLREKFYQPLGLQRTTFRPTSLFPLTDIAPTEIDTFFRHTLIHGQVHDEGAILMRGVSGNAGLFATAKEIGRIYQMLLSPSQYDSLLSAHTISLFTTTQYPANQNRRGLIFDKPLLQYDSVWSSIAQDASSRSFGHSGFTGTLVWADPQFDLVFVFLSNRVYPNRQNKGLYRYNVRPNLHNFIYKEIQKRKD